MALAFDVKGNGVTRAKIVRQKLTFVVFTRCYFSRPGYRVLDHWYTKFQMRINQSRWVDKKMDRLLAPWIWNLCFDLGCMNLNYLLTYILEMGSSWNFTAWASSSYEGSEPSRAELGHFNFRAEIELIYLNLFSIKNT